MRFISLFLLFTFSIYATHIEELTLPKCIKYESIKKVIENDWSYASKRIKKFIEHNSTNYVDIFMELVTKPLVLRTDKEYIQEQLESHQELLDWNLTKGTFPVLENMTDYKKTLHKEIKYNIYSSLDRYKNRMDIDAYRGMYLYIRYLEYTEKFDKIFDIYNKIARHLLDIYTLQNKSMINVMISNIIVEEYIQALTVSLKNNHFSKDQKQILYNTLSQFLLDNKLFSKMLLSEKQEVYKYLNMFYLDANASADTIQKIGFFKGMLKIVEEDDLKQHLNDRPSMHKVVKNYKLDTEKIYAELLSLDTIEEYKAYVEKKESLTETFDYLDFPRIFALYITDKLGYKRLSNVFKYNFTSSEFVKFVRKSYIYFSKPWVLGKYKFEYEERLEKNKKFLDSLKN